MPPPELAAGFKSRIFISADQCIRQRCEVSRTAAAIARREVSALDFAGVFRPIDDTASGHEGVEPAIPCLVGQKFVFDWIRVVSTAYGFNMNGQPHEIIQVFVTLRRGPPCEVLAKS